MKFRGGRVNVRTAIRSASRRSKLRVGMALHSIPAMSTTEADVLAVADRLISAIQAGDIDTVRSIYAPDAVVWHNNDNATQTVEENLRTLTWITRNLKEFRY